MSNPLEEEISETAITSELALNLLASILLLTVGTITIGIGLSPAPDMLQYATLNPQLLTLAGILLCLGSIAGGAKLASDLRKQLVHREK